MAKTADASEKASTKVKIVCWKDCENPENLDGYCSVTFAPQYNLPPAREGDVLEGLPDEVVQSLLDNGYAEKVKEK